MTSIKQRQTISTHNTIRHWFAGAFTLLCAFIVFAVLLLLSLGTQQAQYNIDTLGLLWTPTVFNTCWQRKTCETLKMMRNFNVFNFYDKTWVPCIFFYYYLFFFRVVPILHNLQIEMNILFTFHGSDYRSIIVLLLWEYWSPSPFKHHWAINLGKRNPFKVRRKLKSCG